MKTLLVLSLSLSLSPSAERDEKGDRRFAGELQPEKTTTTNNDLQPEKTKKTTEFTIYDTEPMTRSWSSYATMDAINEMKLQHVETRCPFSATSRISQWLHDKEERRKCLKKCKKPDRSKFWTQRGYDKKK